MHINEIIPYDICKFDIISNADWNVAEYGVDALQE